MRFFKFGEKGDVLAIALPSSLKLSASVKEGDEYEFLDLGNGAFFLVSRSRANELAKTSLLSSLGQRVLSAPPNSPSSIETNPVPSPHEPEPAMLPSDPAQMEKQLDRGGYLVVDENGAKLISQALEPQIKAGLVLGVRGFDKRYYVVSRPFYEEAAGHLRTAVTGKDITLAELANAGKISEEAAIAVLQILKEQGDAIEKRRGVYRLV